MTMSETRNKETFKVLGGAQVDYGGRYEYLMSAYVSLRLLQDPAVAHFKLSNNHEEFGKFDDLVIEATLSNGETETWAVQLKHSKTGKSISKNELAAEGRGDFSICKYFLDCKKRQYPCNTKLVLYTNRQLDEEKQFELTKHVVRTRKSTGTSFMETSANGSVYQLGIEHGEPARKLLEEDKQFFANFYIYANQKNVEQIENDIAQLFADVYQSNGQDKYKKYFEKWCREEPIEGCKDKLYRDDVVFELQRILLEPYVRPVAPKQCDAKGTLLKTVISKFDVTIVKEDWQKHIDNLWITCQRHSASVLIVKVDRFNMATVCKAIDLYKRSFVLIGDLELNSDLNTFKNLSDLHEKDYIKVTESLSCVIQGRKRECLAKILISDELKCCFEVGHLLKMVGDETLVIGDDTVQLPTAYINRSIPKHVFSLDLIKNVGDNDILVISCADFDKLQQTVADLKHVRTKITTSIFAESPAIILLQDKCSTGQFAEICSKSDGRNVYCFEMFGSCLNLLNTHGGNLSNLLKYREIAETTVQDSDILNNFMSKTNVLLGDPGMGKTICADFIQRICPFDLWPVKVNLREKLELFLKFDCDGLLARILRPFDLVHFRNCYGKKILFIWDGLDEVETKDVDKIIWQVQELSRRGYVQWITSRCHLKDKLESSLNVISINLVEITAEDQRNYLETRLRATYERIQEVTDSIHERIVQNKLKDFLGIPLLLFMFTEICLDKVKYQLMLENEISLIQIYGLFIDGKFDHFNQKVMQSENALFSKIEDEIRDYRTIKYQKAALRTCFDNAFLDKFTDNCDGFLKKIDKDGDVYGIITRIGDGNTPIFIHKCFAEYFAARYLSRKYNKVDKEILKELFEERYKSIRFLFDLLLSENCPAHQAVLELNLDKLKIIPANELFGLDNGGRNVFHLVSSYGARRKPLHRIDSTKPRFSFRKYKPINTFDSAPLDSSEQENKDYEQIVKFLLELVENLPDLLYDDKIYRLNFLEYANISLSLYAIDAYSNMLKFKLIDNYKDSETVLAYSAKFDYRNLFENLQDVPYFVLDRLSKPARTSGFQHFDKYDIVILMIEHNRNDMLEKAVKYFGNRINQPTMFNDENSLSWAVRKGNLNIVKLLVRSKVAADRTHAANNTILHVAVAQRQTEIVEYLVAKKLVQIDARNSADDTPLLIAAKLGDFKISKCLIDNGAKVDVKNRHGENVLHVACKSGNPELVRHLLLDHSHSQLLLEQVDSLFGNTPLLTAVRAKDLRIYDALIAAGADLRVKNAMGWNILHCACSAGSFDFVRNLSKQELIELDKPDAWPKDTPMLVAARNGHFDMVEYLLTMEAADVLAANSHRKNVLHYACQNGNLEFVKAAAVAQHLADLGKDADAEGHVPLFYAEEKGHSEIVEYLKAMQL